MLLCWSIRRSVHALSSLTTWRGTNTLEFSWGPVVYSKTMGRSCNFIHNICYSKSRIFDSSTVMNDGSLPISVYGIAAIGTLVGFMSSTDTQKLKDGFDIVFGIQKPNKERGDVPKKGAKTEISVEENINLYR